MKKISVIFGTRPEAIKLAPVILELKRSHNLQCHVCVTAQHRGMLDQVLDVFEIIPDVDFNLMKNNQSLGQLTSHVIASLDRYLHAEKPDMVLIQGDTTTVFCAALVAFYHRIHVGHVEAGLRTGNYVCTLARRRQSCVDISVIVSSISKKSWIPKYPLNRFH
ncbi:hypothetical protein C6A37_08970, partial [Desulfobacteraceae bacterium SEEP-SAG9]